MLPRYPVNSKSLKSVGYHPKARLLEIEFHSGGVYQYDLVPFEVYNALMAAPSKGKYFHAHIKNRYSGRKLGL